MPKMSPCFLERDLLEEAKEAFSFGRSFKRSVILLSFLLQSLLVLFYYSFIVLFRFHWRWRAGACRGLLLSPAFSLCLELIECPPHSIDSPHYRMLPVTPEPLTIVYSNVMFILLMLLFFYYILVVVSCETQRWKRTKSTLGQQRILSGAFLKDTAKISGNVLLFTLGRRMNRYVELCLSQPKVVSDR